MFVEARELKQASCQGRNLAVYQAVRFSDITLCIESVKISDIGRRRRAPGGELGWYFEEPDWVNACWTSKGLADGAQIARFASKLLA